MMTSGTPSSDTSTGLEDQDVASPSFFLVVSWALGPTSPKEPRLDLPRELRQRPGQVGAGLHGEAREVGLVSGGASLYPAVYDINPA